jgi:hypothetical protein
MKSHFYKTTPITALSLLAVGATHCSARSGEDSASTEQALTTWRAVPSPNVAGGNFDQLNGVQVTASNDAWTVGFARVVNKPFRALAEHWNGSTWQIANSASITATDDTRFLGVGGTGRSDLWAVGSDQPAGAVVQGLFEHWNGQTWTRVARPAAEPTGAMLLAVSADSATNVWAVGNSRNPATGLFLPLIESWNGQVWSVVPGATFPGNGEGRMLGVAAISSADVWAIGVNGQDRPTFEHWNGQQWTIVAQAENGNDTSMFGISAVSTSDIWAVGNVIEHWNGTQWSIVTAPAALYTGVVSIATNNVWAVGVAGGQTVSAHWDGTQWTQVATPMVPAGSPAELAGVSGLTGTAVFAAGFQTINGQEQTLILEQGP